MKRLAVFVFVVAVVSVSLFAGPFGLEFGWTKADMEKAGVRFLNQRELGSGLMAYLIDPIQELATFSTYEVRVDSQYGIYYIGASSELDGYSNVKDSFNSITRLLTRSYGEPKEDYGSDVDYLVPNSSEFSYIWRPDAKNGNEISTVVFSLMREGIGYYSAFLQLEYFSHNYDLVEAKLSAIL